MKTDDELLAAAHDLYRRLGGFGSADARLVRGLWERWQAAKALLESTPAPREVLSRERQGDDTTVT